MNNTSKSQLSYWASSVESLYTYLKQKGKNHNHYKSYSNIDSIVNIRNTKYLYLGTGVRWNDKTDRENFNPDNSEYLNFGKCFSFSAEENVAMWMLYGGIDKRGGMIDFTKKGMESILSVQSIEFGHSDNHSFVPDKVLRADFFDLYCVDIIYYKENSTGYYIKRSEESVNNMPKSIFNQLMFCKKAYPWLYENECRLICSVKKSALPITCDVARIDLSELNMGKSFERIYHSPNYPSRDTKNTLKSTLDGSIDWSLCDNPKCERLIVEEVNDET